MTWSFIWAVRLVTAFSLRRLWKGAASFDLLLLAPAGLVGILVSRVTGGHRMEPAGTPSRQPLLDRPNSPARHLGKEIQINITGGVENGLGFQPDEDKTVAALLPPEKSLLLFGCEVNLHAGISTTRGNVISTPDVAQNTVSYNVGHTVII